MYFSLQRMCAPNILQNDVEKNWFNFYDFNFFRAFTSIFNEVEILDLIVFGDACSISSMLFCDSTCNSLCSLYYAYSLLKYNYKTNQP